MTKNKVAHRPDRGTRHHPSVRLGEQQLRQLPCPQRPDYLSPQDVRSRPHHFHRITEETGVYIVGKIVLKGFISKQYLVIIIVPLPSKDFSPTAGICGLHAQHRE